MATLREERARLQFLEEHGRGDEKVHVVFIDEEARERIKNEAKGIVKPKTKFVMETDDPEMYSAFNAEKDRYIRCAVNKSVALSLMHRRLAQLSCEDITKLSEDGHDSQG